MQLLMHKTQISIFKWILNSYVFQVPECENQEVCSQEQDLLGIPGRAKDQQSVDHLCSEAERLRESENPVQIWI